MNSWLLLFSDIECAYYFVTLQANPDYKGVCHVALAQEGHCRPGEVQFFILIELSNLSFILKESQ